MENHGKSRKGFFMPITEILEALLRLVLAYLGGSNRGGQS